jgi:hypothetical protein
VDEVHLLTVDGSHELGLSVEARFYLAPVVLSNCVVDQVPHVLQRHAVVPAGLVQLIGPAHTAQALLKVVEVSLRYLYSVRVDVGAR